MVDPPLALVPPVCAGPARRPFPDLRPDIQRWGSGGESVDTLHALGAAHVQSLPEWAAGGGDLKWVRESVRTWLFHHLFDPHMTELGLRVRASYPHLSSPDAVVSKAWLRAFQWWQKVDRKPVTNPMGWLMNATGYASRDRSSVMGKRFVPLPGDTDGGYDPSDPDAARPDEEAAEAELAGRVVLALSQLPVDDRTLLELKFDEQLSQDELAVALGVSDRTVRRQFSTLINKLRKKLDVPPGETHS